MLGHEPDQFFGFVGVEVVQDDDEALPGVVLDKVADVVCEVLFAAGGADAGANDLAGGYFEASNEGLCPMALIFELAQMKPARAGGLVRVLTLQGLDSGLLVDADDVGSLSGELRSLPVEIGDLGAGA